MPSVHALLVFSGPVGTQHAGSRAQSLSRQSRSLSQSSSLRSRQFVSVSETGLHCVHAVMLAQSGSRQSLRPSQSLSLASSQDFSVASPLTQQLLTTAQ